MNIFLYPAKKNGKVWNIHLQKATESTLFCEIFSFQKKYATFHDICAVLHSYHPFFMPFAIFDSYKIGNHETLLLQQTSLLCISFGNGVLQWDSLWFKPPSATFFF